jgi:plastocyanin
MDPWRTARRRTLRAGTLAAAIGLASLLGTDVALAGAGCHSEAFSDQAGTAVTMLDNCFTPTVLRVGPGDTVTWSNKDPVEHTVTGAVGAFGHDRSILAGQTVAYRFDAEGVYPYFCYLHPGMVGAVVVGDGGAAATGSGVVPVGGSGEGEKASGAEAAPEAAPARSDQDTSRGWWAGLGLGLGLAAAASVGSVAISRRRKRLASRTPAAA